MQPIDTQVKYSITDLIAQCNPDELVPEDAVEIVDSSVLDSEWGQRMVNNMNEMAKNEEYRKTIAKDLS